MSVKSRLLIITRTGSVQLWDGDNIKWTREEGLSSIAAAHFVEIPELVGGEANLDHASEGFFARLLRHISNAQVGSYLYCRGIFEQIHSGLSSICDQLCNPVCHWFICWAV
jgi:hypothetical protein